MERSQEKPNLNNYSDGNIPTRSACLECLYDEVKNLLEIFRSRRNDIPDSLTNKIVTIKYKDVEIVLREDSVSLSNSDGEILSLKKVQEKWESSALKNKEKIGFRKKKFIQGFFLVFKHAEDCNVTVLEDSTKE